MSAISLPSAVELEIPVRPRVAVAIAPPLARAYPPIGVVAKRSTQARAANLLASVLLNVMFMMAVVGVTFVACGFVGNVELESANREAMQSTDRAAVANVTESGLARSVEKLKSDDQLAKWGTFNKFVPPYQLTASVKPPSKK